MKKIFIFVLMIFSLIGCSCKEETIKVRLDYQKLANSNESSAYLYNQFGLLSYELLNTNEFDDKIIDKDSFLLFVYSESCAGCRLLAPALKAYVDETDVVVYTLNYALVSDKHDLYKAGVNTTPFLILIEDGKIVYKDLIKLEFNNEQGNIDFVKNWMEKHVEWGNE